MIPILSDSPTLQGNGLGGLSDAIECVVTDEVNGEYELRMCYPVTGEHYGEIQNNLIIFAEPMALATAQPFRIYRITKPLNGVVTIYARHLAYDMSGIVVKPFSALSLTAALSAVPTYSVPACPFTLTSTRTITSKMEIDEPRPLWTLLGGSAGSFLDVYGGEWEFDGYTATLKTKLGENRGVVIRYGKNLTELENDSDLSSTYGGVFPYWYDEEEGLVTITEGYVPVTGSIYTRILLLDCSSDFDEKPTEAQLRTKAQNYIDNNSVGSPNDSWKVSFAQLAQAGEYETQALLEEVQLGDTVSVIYEALGVNASARVVKTEWDVLGDKYKAVTIGRVKQNLASILVGQNKETERAISQTKSALERAISSATDFIKHGTGVMRFIYNEDGDLMEIVSLDNADLSQAQSVWRWNQGGFGHSSTGYNGTYTTAITQDGQIVADFITAGTLSGNRVRTGLIEDETGTNYWNLDTGEFHSQTLENAISQTEEGISLVSEKLNNIGGRNYAWAMDPSIHARAYLQNCTLTYNPDNNGEYRVVGGSGTNNQQAWYYGSGETGYAIPSELLGEKVIFHADYIGSTGSDATPLVYMLFYDSSDTQVAQYALSPDSLSTTFTVPVSAARMTPLLRVRQSGAFQDGEVLTARGVKLERGEIATDWTPAPEDDAASIASNKAAIEVNSTAISLKVSQTDYNGNTIASLINQTSTSVQIQASKVDLQGYVTFTNLSTSGQTAINGANITTGLIQDQAGKNSWNLNTGAFTITDGSVNVTTSSETENIIQLRYGNYSSFLQPQAVGAALATSSGTSSSAVQANGLRVNGADNTTGFFDRSGISFYDASINDRLILNWSQGLYFKDSAGVKRFQITPYGTITIYASSASSTEYAIGSWSGGTLKLGASDTAGSWPGYIEMYDSNHNPRITIAAGTGVITSQTGTNKYSALIWPDSNGAGRLVLGDGNSTLWRTSLTNDGLTFRDSNNNATASYPATPTTMSYNTSVNAVTSRGSISSGGAYAWGSLIFVSLVFSASANATNSPQIATLPAALNDTALSAIDITSGIGSSIDSAVPCGVAGNGKLYIKTITSGHIYAISGVYPHG